MYRYKKLNIRKEFKKLMIDLSSHIPANKWNFNSNKRQIEIKQNTKTFNQSNSSVKSGK
ncbi:MAG: hypothetical protein Dasosvirus9_2 [Dasosvirus sp.]|uniref:Uncharacterized protein n=1 Tax=Dasosvirus sp. TaxID=2487764 RepID=A0A3G4ZRP7_9VIRU|nr:MAG: hypothetical protein Dasosvirus9_2 [Dasosvirus sp.]